MVAAALDLQLLLEFRQIVAWIIGKFDHVRVALEFEVVDLVQLAVLVEAVHLERGLVELLHLRVQAVIVEGIGTGGLILDVQVHELRAQTHHLVDATDQVVRHLVAEAQSLAHMLVQRDGALPAPLAFAAFQLDFVVLLLVGAGRLAAHLHGGVRRFFTVAEFAGYRPLFVADLQQTVDLVPVGVHGRVIIHGILVDFAPTMVRAFRFVAARDRQIHGFHAAVVIHFVQRVVVAQVRAVQRLRIAFLDFLMLSLRLRRRFACRGTAVRNVSAGDAGKRRHNRGDDRHASGYDIAIAPLISHRHSSVPFHASHVSLTLPSVRKPHAAVRRIRPAIRPVS